MSNCDLVVIELEEENQEEEEEEEDEEALSLCDLPIEEDDDQPSIKEAARQGTDDFDFCRNSASMEGLAMCSADEVFFQGQLLPLRHSVSSESGVWRGNGLNPCRSISRSESMDRCSSVGYTSPTSRSSSIGSQHSSSSGGGSSNTGPNLSAIYTRPAARGWNQFHSHSCPTPHMRFSGGRRGNASRSGRKSNAWNALRLGLVPATEIVGLQSLMARAGNANFSNWKKKTAEYPNGGENGKNTKQIRRFDGLIGGLFGDCKCSVDAVETVPLRQTSVGSGDGVRTRGREKEEHPRKMEAKRRQRKRATSYSRTFEWLKQLSIQGAPDDSWSQKQ